MVSSIHVHCSQHLNKGATLQWFDTFCVFLRISAQQEVESGLMRTNKMASKQCLCWHYIDYLLILSRTESKQVQWPCVGLGCEVCCSFCFSFLCSCVYLFCSRSSAFPEEHRSAALPLLSARSHLHPLHHSGLELHTGSLLVLQVQSPVGPVWPWSWDTSFQLTTNAFSSSISRRWLTVIKLGHLVDWFLVNPLILCLALNPVTCLE